MSSKSANPVSVSFVGHTTNPPVNTDVATAIGNESETVFRLTNHTGLRVSCQFQVEGTNRASGLTTCSSACIDLLSHACRDVSVVCLGGANGWRFETLLSSYTTRPYLYYRVRSVLTQVGVHPGRRVDYKVFPELTNVWTTP